jgi:hypothetical protein
MVVCDEIKCLALVLQADGRFHRTEKISNVEFSAWLKAGEDAHGAECGFQAGKRSRTRTSAAEIAQVSENRASTISTHLMPGITLRSIWFIT